eukprot:jgi/Chrzof1/1466/Cz10g08280.t1_UROD1
MGSMQGWTGAPEDLLVEDWLRDLELRPGPASTSDVKSDPDTNHTLNVPDELLYAWAASLGAPASSQAPPTESVRLTQQSTNQMTNAMGLQPSLLQPPQQTFMVPSYGQQQLLNPQQLDMPAARLSPSLEAELQWQAILYQSSQQGCNAMRDLGLLASLLQGQMPTAQSVGPYNQQSPRSQLSAPHAGQGTGCAHAIPQPSAANSHNQPASDASGTMQRAASQAQASDEPDMSHMTVMQRYHARRKLALQRMEKEVEEKLAQVALLEQENSKLKKHAQILENIVADIDKQVELMTVTDSADTSQWMKLLGIGSNKGMGYGRNLDRILDGGASINVAEWTVQDMRVKWRVFMEELRPLLRQADEARHAAVASATAAGGDTPMSPPQADGDVSSSNNSGKSATSPATSSSADDQDQRQPAAAAAAAAASSKHRYSPPAGNPEGVTPQLLAQIEPVVYKHFVWLMAILTRNHLLTFQFFSTDVEGKGRPLPSPDDPKWMQLAGRIGLTNEQLEEVADVYHLAVKLRERVIAERGEIIRSLQLGPEISTSSVLPAVKRIDGQVQALDRMRANLRKEGIIRNMVGCYLVNVLSLWQLGKVCYLSYPFFPMAWPLVDAGEKLLQLQKQAAAKSSVHAAQRKGGRNRQ